MMDYPSIGGTVAIVGLGYVGIPLLVEILKISESRKIIGFDVNTQRIEKLNALNSLSEYGYQGSLKHYIGSNSLELTSEQNVLGSSEIYIIAVPTPVDNGNKPDLSFIQKATDSIYEANRDFLTRGERKKIIIYESTVYPGATREVHNASVEKYVTRNDCIKIGYSPERINPGDEGRKLANIVKVTSGEDAETARWVDCFYKSFISAGTHLASSIEVAEAAKIIENTQRDVNIALVNELALICSRLNINTNDVLEAAKTKWNFLDFSPGLVGGHCIGIDPYYLAHKAETLGIHPKVILAGRSVNDGMPGWISRKIFKCLISDIGGGKKYSCLLMGITFKEDCSDTRNSKSLELCSILASYGVSMAVTDPYLEKQESANTESTSQAVHLHLKEALQNKYDCIIIAVQHKEYKNMDHKLLFKCLNYGGFVYDLKNIINMHPSKQLKKL